MQRRLRQRRRRGRSSSRHPSDPAPALCRPPSRAHVPDAIANQYSRCWLESRSAASSGAVPSTGPLGPLPRSRGDAGARRLLPEQPRPANSRSAGDRYPSSGPDNSAAQAQPHRSEHPGRRRAITPLSASGAPSLVPQRCVPDGTPGGSVARCAKVSGGSGILSSSKHSRQAACSASGHLLRSGAQIPRGAWLARATSPPHVAVRPLSSAPAQCTTTS
jgi:hypothetical protein